jgi:SAM-dependent methyltransferase
MRDVGNVERFTGRVAEYERYRTRYPAEMMEVLRERCGLTAESVVADVGAGTGMLAEMFLANGNRVVAIEPNAEMRAVCGGLAERYPGLEVRDATAEATGLGDGSVDYVTAGRAFHWFDPERTRVEFGRVLRRGGWVVLASSGRAKDGAEVLREYERILLEYGTDYGRTRLGYGVYEEFAGLFGGGEMVRAEFKGEQGLTLAEFLGQTQSLSVVPRVGDAGYEAMRGALGEFFRRFAVDGVVTMATVCYLQACRVG